MARGSPSCRRRMPGSKSFWQRWSLRRRCSCLKGFCVGEAFSKRSSRSWPRETCEPGTTPQGCSGPLRHVWVSERFVCRVAGQHRRTSAMGARLSIGRRSSSADACGSSRQSTSAGGSQVPECDRLAEQALPSHPGGPALPGQGRRGRVGGSDQR